MQSGYEGKAKAFTTTSTHVRNTQGIERPKQSETIDLTSHSQSTCFTSTSAQLCVNRKQLAPKQANATLVPSTLRKSSISKGVENVVLPLFETLFDNVILPLASTMQI